jgi:hypothetical protein
MKSGCQLTTHCARRIKPIYCVARPVKVPAREQVHIFFQVAPAVDWTRRLLLGHAARDGPADPMRFCGTWTTPYAHSTHAGCLSKRTAPGRIDYFSVNGLLRETAPQIELQQLQHAALCHNGKAKRFDRLPIFSLFLYSLGESDFGEMNYTLAAVV